MSKITVTFDTHNEEDQFDIFLFQNSKKMYFIISEFQNEIRNLIKYEPNSENAELLGLQKAKDIFNDMINDYGLNLDEVK